MKNKTVFFSLRISTTGKGAFQTGLRNSDNQGPLDNRGSTIEH